MGERTDQSVVLVSFQDECRPGFSRFALKHRLGVLDGRQSGALRRVLACQPKAVIVQVPPRFEEGLRLLSRIAGHWCPVAAIAVAGDGSPDLERLIRSAGVRACLSPTADAGQIEVALTQCAPGWKAAAAQSSGRPGVPVVPAC